MLVFRHITAALTLLTSVSSCTPSASRRQERLPKAETPTLHSAAHEPDAPAGRGPPSNAEPEGGGELGANAPRFVAKPYAECGMPKRLFDRGWHRRLEPTASDESAPFVPGSVTLAVLPDTQYYASCNSPHFYAQSRWVADTAGERNTVAAIHLGDITEHNTAAEWQYAVRSLLPIQRRLPTILVTGNHDHGDDGTANRRWTLFNDYFGQPPPPTAATLAESKVAGDLENAYYRLKLPQVTLGVLALEWSPRSDSVDWANAVLTKYARDRVVFVTHAYLYYDGTRYDFAKKGEKQEWNPRVYGTGKRDTEQPAGKNNVAEEGTYDGQMLWDALLSRHPGVFLTLNGHVLGDGVGLLTSEGTEGNLVHQVLVNYQMLDEGGLGYLRLIELLPDGRTLRMKTYSPSLERFATGEEQNFDLVIEPPLWR